jgi:hypothetical protein
MGRERRICIERSVADHQKCGPRETVVDEDRDAAAVVRATAAAQQCLFSFGI